MQKKIIKSKEMCKLRQNDFIASEGYYMAMVWIYKTT